MALVTFKFREWTILLGILAKLTGEKSMYFLYDKCVKRTDSSDKAEINTIIAGNVEAADPRFNWMQVYILLLIMKGVRQGKYLNPIYEHYTVETRYKMANLYSSPEKIRKLITSLKQITTNPSFLTDETFRQLSLILDQDLISFTHESHDFFSTLLNE